MILHAPIDLGPHLNAVGATSDSDRAGGAVNAWGNSFPAEELPYGRTLTVSGVPFLLPAKERGKPDHLEALGQLVELPALPGACGLSLLCFGEMGDQELDIEMIGSGVRRALSVLGRAWLVQHDPPQGARCHVCSHLHYPGDYELAALRPTLWCWETRWPLGAPFVRLALGMNPLFHVFAATLLGER